VLLLGAFPWTVLFPAAVSGLKTKGFHTSFRRFILCWFAFPFLFFSSSSGKLATYILPCFLPLALLLTQGFSDYFSQGKKALFDRATILMILFPILSAIAIGLLQQGIFNNGDILFSESWKIGLFMTTMVLFLCFLIAAVKTTVYEKKLILFAISPLFFYTSAHMLTPDQAFRRNSPCPFIVSKADKITPDTLVVSASTPIKSVCWSLKRNDIFLLDDGGELGYGFGQENSKHRQLNFNDFRTMVNNNKGVRKVVLILDERRYNRWKDILPQPVSLEDSGKDGYILATF
jgi:4-amino-4-deoxy-L-arabinose transferase